MKSQLVQFVPHAEISKYLGMGWVIADDLASCHHGDFSVIMKKNERKQKTEAGKAQNAWNSLKRKSNRSGYKGVYKNKNKWSAKIRVCGKHITLGSFDTPELASDAYKAASIRLHGEFARNE